jgi:hypothetical protein
VEYPNETMKNKQAQKISIASLLVGALQLIYNIFITDAQFVKILPTLFEGTFMFIIVGFLFILLFKKDIFKNWFLFGIVLSLIHSLFMLIPLGFNLGFLLSLFIFKLLSVILSIKFTDYIIKD